MDYSRYFEILEGKYEKYFDVEKNIYLLDEKIDLCARFKAVSNRTFITKNDVVDSYNNNEYCLVKSFENITLEEAQKFSEVLKSSMVQFVTPDRNHMSSYITGVIVSKNSVSNEIQNWVKGFRYNKVYMLYLHGWSEVRLVLVDLSKNLVTTNRSGKKVKKVYQVTP